MEATLGAASEGRSTTLEPTVLDAFESRRQHAFEKIRWSVPEHLRSGAFLDIGCGTGNGLVAALQHGFSTAVGVDRDLHEFVWFDASRFNEICDTYGVDHTKATLIESDIFQERLDPDGYEVVFMLDSIEHVPDPMAFVDRAASLVAPGGVLLIDTCPLYYSPAGHHLFDSFQPERYPWVHLRRDFHELCAQAKVTDWSWQRFEELNKVTHDAIKARMQQNGLTIIQEHRSMENETTRAALEKHRPILELSSIDEKLLFEDWTLLVGQR